MAPLRIDPGRLLARLQTFNRIGALPEGGNCRLALTDADREGRDLLVTWMRERGLAVTIDAIGNIIGVRAGRDDLEPVMFGSHVDTVGTGGRYDGLYGVLAGLEICETLNDIGLVTRRPLALVAWTNEEGARFSPYALGSLTYVGGLSLDDAYAVTGIDGLRVGDELARIGYRGPAAPGWLKPHAYVELHIEQGPVLEDEDKVIGAVEGIPCMVWLEVTIEGRSSHAGATPMHLRHDALLVASEIAVFVRNLADEIGGSQRGTVGRMDVTPNLVNVVAQRVAMTVDLRNMDDSVLRSSEERLREFVAGLERRETVRIGVRDLTRFAATPFAPDIIRLVESTANSLGYSSRRLPSGAGHDAQMLARICPSGMIFVPSIGGLSHNVNEDTTPEHLAAGADVLLNAVLQLAA